jgi:hypothetical protein
MPTWAFLIDQPSESAICAKERARTIFTRPKSGVVLYRILFRTSTGITTCILDIQPSLYNHGAESVNKRGWTLQESALAKRLLIFSSTVGLIAGCNKGARCCGEFLGDPLHEEAGFGGRGEQVAIVEAGVDSDDDSDKGTLNVHKTDRTAGDAERTDERQGEASEGSLEHLDRIFQVPWNFQWEMSRRDAERLAISSEEEKLEQEKAAKIANVVDEWLAAVQDCTRRDLTHLGDTLVALGALLKRTMTNISWDPTSLTFGKERFWKA